MKICIELVLKAILSLLWFSKKWMKYDKNDLHFFKNPQKMSRHWKTWTQIIKSIQLWLLLTVGKQETESV